jgi:hypothetical protein
MTARTQIQPAITSQDMDNFRDGCLVTIICILYHQLYVREDFVIRKYGYHVDANHLWANIVATRVASRARKRRNWIVGQG